MEGTGTSDPQRIAAADRNTRIADRIRQSRIQFGGVQLPPVTWKGAVGHAPGLQPFPGPTYDRLLDAHQRQLQRVDHGNPPAGEDTPEARLVAVSRISLAARIKHGVPLSELVSHVTTLADLEARLMHEL